MSETTPTRRPDFLGHREGDSVVVAVRDLVPGLVTGGYLAGHATVEVELRDSIPLGHKFALVDIAQGAGVVEYGVRIGVASHSIARGEYVHVHNLSSARWQNSIG